MHPADKKSLAKSRALVKSRAAVLVACALGAATVAHGAEPKSKKTEEQQIVQNLKRRKREAAAQAV